MTDILFCSGPTLALSSFLILWFDYSLPVQIFRCLRFLPGWRKKPWPDSVEMLFWTRSLWSQWILTNLSPKTVYLLECQGCLATRITLLLAPAWGASYWLLRSDVPQALVVTGWALVSPVAPGLLGLWAHRKTRAIANPENSSSVPPPVIKKETHRAVEEFPTAEHVATAFLRDGDSNATQCSSPFPGCDALLTSYQRARRVQEGNCADCDLAKLKREWRERAEKAYQSYVQSTRLSSTMRPSDGRPSRNLGGQEAAGN